MKATKDGICSETKKPISIGDKICFVPRVMGIPTQVFCESSQTFEVLKSDVAHTGYKDGL